MSSYRRILKEDIASKITVTIFRVSQQSERKKRKKEENVFNKIED
jgi:hypothetical protein